MKAKSVCSSMAAFLNKHDSTIKAECVTRDYYGRQVDDGIKSAAGKCDVMLALMTKARTNPCDYNDCGGKGSCAAKSASTTCTCGDAFTNFEKTCVTNSCAQNECVADNTESCSVTGEGTYACACKKGFAGNRCQEDVDGCAGNPCGANGDCADTVGANTNDVAYKCKCTGNWAGLKCDAIGDSCTDTPRCSASESQGTCTSCTSADQAGAPASAMCCFNGACTEEHTAMSKSFDKSPMKRFASVLEADPTLANFDPLAEMDKTIRDAWMSTPEKAFYSCMAKCTQKLATKNNDNYYAYPYEARDVAFATAEDKSPMAAKPKFTCKCNAGFEGRNCESNVDECAGNDCSGRGKCVDGANAYTCQCETGYDGKDCENNIDDCKDVDCGDLSVAAYGCTDGVNSYMCNCKPGWSTDNSGACTVESQYCIADPPCSGHGTCQNNPDKCNYKCTCNGNWDGGDCETDLCANVNCGAHGDCNKGVCECEANYSGELCEVTKCDGCGVCDEDASNDCKQDCAGDWGGSAVVDTCNKCVANQGEACVQDCAGNDGGTAFVDECDNCVANRGEACKEDCNGKLGGTAIVDGCNQCVADQNAACKADCNGELGGSSFLDRCNNCLEAADVGCDPEQVYEDMMNEMVNGGNSLVENAALAVERVKEAAAAAGCSTARARRIPPMEGMDGSMDGNMNNNDPDNMDGSMDGNTNNNDPDNMDGSMDGNMDNNDPANMGGMVDCNQLLSAISTAERELSTATSNGIDASGANSERSLVGAIVGIIIVGLLQAVV